MQTSNELGLLAVRLVVAVFATWRVAHLLAFEDGPFALVARLRRAAGRHGTVLDCFYCLSLWLALPLAAWATGWPAVPLADGLCSTLGISGAAAWLHRLATPPVALQTLPTLPNEEHDHGLLWTDAGVGQHGGAAKD